MLVIRIGVGLPIEVEYSISMARSKVSGIALILAYSVVGRSVLTSGNVLYEEKKIFKAVKFLVVLIN